MVAQSQQIVTLTYIRPPNFDDNNDSDVEVLSVKHLKRRATGRQHGKNVKFLQNFSDFVH